MPNADNKLSKKITISILGFGNVGKFIGSQLLRYPELEIMLNLVDPDESVVGAVEDLRHAAQLAPNFEIAYNSQDLLNDSDFIFHCAGASVPKGQSRLVTCKASIDITEKIFQNYSPKKQPIIIVLANPVEVIAHVTQKITALPAEKVIGTGTLLDSIRLNYLIKREFSHFKSVNTVVLGEHGSSAFLSRSLSTINGENISKHLSNHQIDDLMQKVKSSAEEIKQTQKATIYGVGNCAIEIFETMVFEKSKKLALSCRVPESFSAVLQNSALYLSFYCELDRTGTRAILPKQSAVDEIEAFKRSSDLLLPCFPKSYL